MYAWLAWSPRTLNDYDQTKHGKELHTADGRFTFVDSERTKGGCRRSD